MTRGVGFLAILLLFSKSVIAAPSCNVVVQQVDPCIGFLKGNMYGLLDDQPSPSCCSGVKDIDGMVKSPGDRITICECLQAALADVGPYDPSRIPLLGKKCGLPNSLPPIDSKTDCSRTVILF